MKVVDLVSWNTAGAFAPNDDVLAFRVAQVVRQMRGDVVLLQEVNGLVFAYLKDLLPRNRIICCPRPSRDGSFEALCVVIPGGSATTVLSHERLLLTEDEDHPTSAALDAKYPRIAQIVHASSNGNAVTLVNLHLDKRGARSRMSAQFLIRKGLPEDRPSVILGDFNESSRGPVGRALVGAGFVEARLGGSPIAGPYGVVVDFAFGRCLFDLTAKYRRIGNLSDHPVLEVRATLNGGKRLPGN